MNPDVKLQKLTEMLKLLDEGLTKTEFTNAFKEVMKVVKDIKDTSSKEWDDLKKVVPTINEIVNASTSKTLAELQKKIEQALQSQIKSLEAKLKTLRDGKTPSSEELTSLIKPLIPVVTDGKPGERGSPDTGEDIIKKINDANSVIDQSAIKGLEETIKQLRKETAMKSNGVTRRIYQPYVDDLSASTNGSSKTFTLSRAPLRTGNVMVYGTDFPTILRPMIDFTVADKILTLTSAVPAPNTGATLICTYFA